jgi:hypothetical protein
VKKISSQQVAVDTPDLTIEKIVRKEKSSDE